MAIDYANIKVLIKNISLNDKPASMLAVSAKGTVPVLVLDKGNHKQVLDESRDIMLWALSINDPNKWYYGLNVKQQLSIDKLIDYNDDEFKSLLDKYKYTVRFPEQSQIQSRDSAEHFLAELNLCLEHHHYLISDAISLADIAIFPFIRQFSMVDIQWFNEAPYLHLQQWLKGFVNSSLFQRIMVKQ